MKGHSTLDAKIDFTREFRWVLDGHKSPSSIRSAHARIASRRSVRTTFVCAELTELEALALDARSAYLQALTSKKQHAICRPEFGLENFGKVAAVKRTIHGGKDVGRNFRNHSRS